MEQKQKKIPNNKLITTDGDLKRFSHQLETRNMTDEQFRKAYWWFKRPAYYQNTEESDGIEEM